MENWDRAEGYLAPSHPLFLFLSFSLSLPLSPSPISSTPSLGVKKGSEESRLKGQEVMKQHAKMSKDVEERQEIIDNPYKMGTPLSIK